MPPFHLLRKPQALPAHTFAFFALLVAPIFSGSAGAQVFRLPTANPGLVEPNGGEKFFAGTVGKPWTSGLFGCVRSEGWQMHEGVDIRCLERDHQGEPVDPVLATAAGTVAYVNAKPSLSNYGRYIILRHQVEGVEIYSLYAHLREVRPEIKVGRTVQAGEPIAIMGRSSNTAQTISKERAHLHFEFNFMINDRFALWYKKSHRGERNDHGDWNGQNFLGLDPRAIFLQQEALKSKFSLLEYVRTQPELCRALVRVTSFPYLRHYAPLIKANPTAEKEGIAGYEIALNFNGVPIQLIPRAASEIKSKSKFQLLSVNTAEQQKNPCRQLVRKRGSRW